MPPTLPKKKINSRDKGARGERALAQLLTENGFPARRGQQFSGGADSPDVVCDSLKHLIHLECKYVEAFSLFKAMEQAKTDAAPGIIPVVAHKKNHSEWVAILPFTDFLRLLKNENTRPATS